MASINDLVRGLREVLRGIAEGERHLDVAEAKGTEAADTYKAVLRGSGQPEERVLAGLGDLLHGRLAEVRAALELSRRRVAAIIHEYTGARTAPPAPAARERPEQPLESRIEQAKQRVGRNPVGSSPAHGEWVRSDGWNVRMRSGSNDDYHSAWWHSSGNCHPRNAPQAGWPPTSKSRWLSRCA